MSVSMKEIGVYLPEAPRPLAEVEITPPVAPAQLKIFERFYGLKHIAISEISLLDMMINAARDALQKSSVSPQDIALVVHAHTAPETWTHLNSLLPVLCRRLGLNQAQSFALHSNNCASSLNGLMLAEPYLANKPGKYLLLITADLTFSGILQQIPNTTLCGDGATACLLGTSEDDPTLRALSMQYAGRHARGSWQTPDEQAEFERRYGERLSCAMTLCLEEADLGWDEIRWVFPHNVNLISWRETAEKLGLPIAKFYLEQVPNWGHCFGADIFINWAKAGARLRPGDKIMLATVGLGAVFGAAIFEIPALNQVTPPQGGAYA